MTGVSGLDVDAMRDRAEAVRDGSEWSVNTVRQLARDVLALVADREALQREVAEWKCEAELSKWPKEAAQAFHQNKQRVAELEAALDSIDEVTGPYDDGYVEEVKSIISKTRAVLAAAASRSVPGIGEAE